MTGASGRPGQTSVSVISSFPKSPFRPFPPFPPCCGPRVWDDAGRMALFMEGVGWTGAVLVLLAYFLVSAGRAEARSANIRR